MFPYRIVTEWSEADACFVARVPALPSCAAHGDTAAEAASEVQTAAKLMLDVLGDAAPAPDQAASYSGNLRLRLPRYLHAALARRAALEGVSLNQILVTLLAEGAAPRVLEMQTKPRAIARPKRDAKPAATSAKRASAARARAPGRH